MPKAKVAVITRTKNRNILLKRALESVLNQSFEDWIMVVVNDGGNQEEVEALCSKYAGQFKERLVIIYNPESLGMEAASNKGIKASESEYVIIHDDDDSWNPEFLRACIEKLEQCTIPTVKGIVTRSMCVYEKIENDVVEIMRQNVFNSDLESISLAQIARINPFPPISFLYKREVYAEIGYYDQTLPVLGDWDFNLRFLEKFDILLEKQVLANYHHRLTDMDSNYSNTIIGGKDRHILYDTLLRNRMMRNDFQQNRLGLGFLVNIGFDAGSPAAPKATDNRFKLYYNVLNQWLKLKNENKSIATYFVKNGYQKIAIYGIGELGNRLFEELRTSDITVQYFIDKNRIREGQRVNDVLVVNIEEIHDQPKVDAVIITPVYDFEAIKKQLQASGVNYPLVSLEQLVDSKNF